MDETIRAKVVSRSLRAPDRNQKTTRVFPQKRNRDCRPLVSVNHTDNETDRQTPKHLPPPDQHTPSAELQIKHIQSARGLVTLKHTHTQTHTETQRNTQRHRHIHTHSKPHLLLLTVVASAPKTTTQLLLWRSCPSAAEILVKICTGVKSRNRRD